MLRSSSIVLGIPLLASAGILVWLSGCGQPTQQTAPPTDAAQAPSHDAHDHEHSHGHADDKEIAAELSKLSPEDRALAEKQKVCPVGGDLLGSMGAPIKLIVEGRELFICCEGCEDAVRENPEKYFSKLDEHAH